jgi:peptidoglycan/xylan/chitin deacetylase (PgdA/CDA1 family)
LDERRAAIQQILGKLKYFETDRRFDVTAALAQRVSANLPGDLMMTSRQVVELHRNGMTVGAHTATHPILLKLTSTAAQDEIASGKAALEQLISAPVTLFAYPNGKPNQDYREEHVITVKELGFDGAVSTAWGTARVGSDVFQIPRFTPWDRKPLKYASRLLQNLLRGDHAVV